MTRDDLSRRRPLTLPTDDGCARFIGRVGTLAVALGIGAAVASSPGVAWADDDESASSATTSSSSSGVSQSSKSSASHDGAAKANSLPAHGSTSPQSANTTDSQPETTDDDPVTDPSTEPSADSPSKPVSDDEVPEHSKPNKPHRTSSRKLVDHSQDTEQRTAVKAIAADSVEAEPPVTADDTEPAQLATASFAKVAAAHTVATLSDAPAAAQTKPPAHPATVVAEAVSSLLSVVGLSPLATGGAPVPPPQSPTLWAMLGWVRREVGHVSEPATQARLPRRRCPWSSRPHP